MRTLNDRNGPLGEKGSVNSNDPAMRVLDEAHKALAKGKPWSFLLFVALLRHFGSGVLMKKSGSAALKILKAVRDRSEPPFHELEARMQGP
jgi:hypothetical protein